MNAPEPPQTDDFAASEPKVPTGLRWQEFFHELGRGPQAIEERSYQGGNPKAVQQRTLYTSENGDRWSLVRDGDTGRVFVRHTPNLSSGGQVSDMEVGDFLSRGGMGPEKQELLRLIGSVVEG